MPWGRPATLISAPRAEIGRTGVADRGPRMRVAVPRREHELMQRVVRGAQQRPATVAQRSRKLRHRRATRPPTTRSTRASDRARRRERQQRKQVASSSCARGGRPAIARSIAVERFGAARSPRVPRFAAARRRAAPARWRADRLAVRVGVEGATAAARLRGTQPAGGGERGGARQPDESERTAMRDRHRGDAADSRYRGPVDKQSKSPLDCRRDRWQRPARLAPPIQPPRSHGEQDPTAAQAASSGS